MTQSYESMNLKTNCGQVFMVQNTLRPSKINAYFIIIQILEHNIMSFNYKM